MELLQNVDLKPYNTFGISAIAKSFVQVRSETELQDLLAYPKIHSVPKLPLGGGSNVLLTKDFEGVVIKMDFPGIKLLEESDDFYRIQVGAGENWHQFVLTCVNNNWPGVENLSLIPGNVGAAPMQNIGAYGMEVKQVIESVRAYLPFENKYMDFSNTDCEFGYRSSIFKTRLKNEAYITSVTFRLPKNHQLNTSYGIIEQQLETMNVQNPSLKDVSNAVIAIRSAKLPDPNKIGNAGSFFKNPVVPAEIARNILNKYPTCPQYPADENQIKIPAGWLIETAGWKGKTFDKKFGIHKNQALVLVNYGGATGRQIYDLSQNILEDVYERFGILLEREVNII